MNCTCERISVKNCTEKIFSLKIQRDLTNFVRVADEHSVQKLCKRNCKFKTVNLV